MVKGNREEIGRFIGDLGSTASWLLYWRGPGIVAAGKYPPGVRTNLKHRFQELPLQMIQKLLNESVKQSTPKSTIDNKSTISLQVVGLGVVREGDKERVPYKNHCHPRVTVGISNTVFPEQ